GRLVVGRGRVHVLPSVPRGPQGQFGQQGREGGDVLGAEAEQTGRQFRFLGGDLLQRHVVRADQVAGEAGVQERQQGERRHPRGLGGGAARGAGAAVPQQQHG